MSESVPPPFPALQEPGPRVMKRTWRGNLLRWCGRMVMLTLIACVAMLSAKAFLPRSPRITAVEEERSTPSKPVEKIVTLIAPANEEPKSIPLPSQQNPEEQKWEQAVVTIESHSTESRHVHGSGVVLGETGLIATNLHVTRPCLEASVQFSDGTRYDVAGFAAVDAEHDLALLRLRDAPANLPGLPLSVDEPPRRRKVWAIGHPRGIEFSVSTGEVSRVLTSNDLPLFSQKFLRQLMPASPDTRWVQHSAPVSPGNSGGPLVDERGQLLGINTWVDERAKFSYALMGEHIQELLEQVDPKTTIPLEDYADAAARANHALWELSPQQLQQLVANAKEMQWRPTNREEYRRLQQLAYAITVSLWPDAVSARGSLAAKLEALAKSADQAVRELRRQPWNDPAQITFLNEFAADELERPQVGLFFFASIERLVEGDDGRRGLIANLAGFERPVFLALPSDQLSVPEAGSQCLVVGVNQSGQVVKYGNNPLKPTIAPIIATRTMVVLGKE